MQDQKRNNVPNSGDDINPYMDSNLYPVYTIVSCSFLDPYVQNYLHSYNVMLPGNPKYGSKSVYFTQVYKEFSMWLDKISVKVSDLSEFLNKNKMKELYLFYDKFKKNIVPKTEEDLENAYNQMSELFDPDATDETNTYLRNKDAFKSAALKDIFLRMLSDFIVDPIQKEINIYNEDKHKPINFIINDTHMLCIDRRRGVIRRPDNMDMEPYQIGYIANSSNELFNAYYRINKEPTKCLFVLDVHLLINIKNRPFMLLTNVTKDTVDKGTINFMNSKDLIEGRNYKNNDADIEFDDNWDDDEDFWDDDEED